MAPKDRYVPGFKFSAPFQIFGQEKTEDAGIDKITPRRPLKACRRGKKANNVNRGKEQSQMSEGHNYDLTINADHSQVQAKIPSPPKAHNLPQSNVFNFGANPGHDSEAQFQMPPFPTTASENKAISHAGFSFSLGFVADSKTQQFQADDIEKMAMKSDKINFPNDNFAKADHSQIQAHPPLLEKQFSPPRLNSFSFSSETFNQPSFSGPANSSTSTHSLFKGLGTSINAQGTVAQSQEKTTKPAGVAKAETKATKTKLSAAKTVAAAVASRKKLNDEREAAEEKQREGSKKQRKAAMQKKKNGYGKTGRA